MLTTCCSVGTSCGLNMSHPVERTEGALCDVPGPRLQNIVATFAMRQPNEPLDLNRMAMLVPYMEFNAKRFAAGVVRLVNPKTTCLVFASGKGVCTGAKTEEEAKLAALKYVRLLSRSGEKLTFRNFRVQNMVAAVHCNFRLDLVGISSNVTGYVSYEPHLFPGLMYRKRIQSTGSNKMHTLVFICFQSGKCVITGGRDRNQILQSWRVFYRDVLLNHIATVDYGSSGNYRVMQYRQLAKNSEDIFLRQITCTEPPENPETLKNMSDLQQLVISQNMEFKAIQRTLAHVMDKDRFDQPTTGAYEPQRMATP